MIPKLIGFVLMAFWLLVFKVDENFGISRIEIFIFSGTGKINIYFNNKWGFSSIGKKCVQKISQNSKKIFLKR